MRLSTILFNKTILMILISVLFQTGIFSQNSFVSFSQNEKLDPLHPTLPKLVYDDDGINGIILEYRFPGAEISEIIVNNTTYNYLHIEGFSKMKDIGNPALPSHTDIIAAPENAKFKIRIIETTYEELSSFMIHPALSPATDRYGDPEPPFVINQQLYNINAFFPDNIISISEQQKIRNIPLAFIQIRPVQFNPVTGKIRVYSKIKYKIEFTGNNLSTATLGQDNSSHYIKIIRNYILNNSIITDNNVESKINGDRKDYIIITHPNYLEAADSLKKWKQQLGYSVEIVSKSGWTSAQIKDSIHSRYHNWSPHPDYFVIIGDHDLVPGEIHQDPNYGDDFATDLYYACMDGPADFIADMGFGRISVSSASQAMQVVQKIINYERNPVNDVNFYNTGINCAQFQDESPQNGYADRRFAQTSEDALNYLSGTLGYNVSRVYKTEPSVTPTNWNNGYYSNGEPLPPYLLKPGFPWDGDATDITNGINAGAFYVLHRDHGYVGGSGWHRPYYVKSSIDNLNNGNKVPVVFSINCHTGEYQLNECFAEKFLRKTNGGAVGVIAAAYYSYSGYNDGFTLGIFDAIWSNPGLIPNFTGSGGIPNPIITPHSDIFTMGDVMNQGLIRMAETWGQDSYTHELFHYFGDPAMKIWTAQPVPITANHVDTIPCGSTSITISGCNCADATATLFYNNTLIGITQLSSGSGTINFNDTINDPLLSSTLTISGHNFIPYIIELPTGSCDIPPVTDFIASDTIAIICGNYHSVISFTDLSINSPNFWIWSFVPSTVTFVNGTNQNSQNPEVIFNAPGSYSVSLKAYNNYGANTKIKYNYIDVNEVIGITLPFTEDFESGNFINNSWTVENPDGLIGWDIHNPIAGNPPGNNSAFLNHYVYGSIGAKDELISPQMDFSGHNSIVLSFKHAYTRRSSTATDSLLIYISTNCGDSWEKIAAFGENGSGSFATAPDQSYKMSSLFYPASADDWCGNGAGSECKIINLSPWAGNKAISIKFQTYNNWGNTMFIDDINIEGATISLTADFTANQTVICPGENIDFTDLSTGWPNSWSWEFEGGTPSTSNQQDPTAIQYNNPGTYDVKLVIGNGADSDSLIKYDYITVLNPPQITKSNDTTICSGDCTILSVSGGNTYLWNTGDESYNITVCPTITTSYSVTVTDSNGCTNSDEITVTVNTKPNPYVSGTKIICKNECTDLLAFGGASYHWSNGETTNPITVCPSSTTIYTVTATSNQGCTGKYEVTVNVNPLPIANAGPNTTITYGYCATLNASGGQTYLWSTGEQYAQISVCPTTTTTYTVTVTDINGCSASDEVQITVLPIIVTSIETVPEEFCPGDNIVLEINATQINNVGAFSLVLNYDTTVLSYQGYTLNPALLATFHIINDVNGQVRTTCASPFYPINIGNGVLLEYTFKYLGDSCNLTWNTAVPGDCEYRDINQFVLPSAFVDGIIDPAPCPEIVDIQAKVFLQGPYSGSGIMNTLINQADSFPHMQPFNISPWSYYGFEQVSTIPANIVDWVLIEIRDSTDINQVVDRRAGLLLNNGQIVDTNFTTGIEMSSIAEGYYYVVIRHMNHLPVMTANPVMLPNTVVIDFSDTTNTSLYGSALNSSIQLEPNIYGMIGGDVNRDGTLKYSGPGNDRSIILQKIINESGSTNITTTLTGYFKEDLKLDETLRYSGPQNDPSIIIQNLINLTGSSSITIIFTTPVPEP